MLMDVNGKSYQSYISSYISELEKPLEIVDHCGFPLHNVGRNKNDRFLIHCYHLQPRRCRLRAALSACSILKAPRWINGSMDQNPRQTMLDC